MEAPPAESTVTVETYLKEELLRDRKHEYWEGKVFRMPDSSEAHNVITGNLAMALYPQLRRGPCHLYILELKVWLSSGSKDYLLYPDLVVTREPYEPKSYWLRQPEVVVEVLAPATEERDRREKYWAYRSADSLEEYVLVAQDRREVIVFRKADNWQPEILTASEAALELRSLNVSLPLAAIYEGVKV